MKRILIAFLALVLVLTIVPFQTFAAQGDKLIAITFDDGPDSTDTPRLLDGLKERGVHVTFFMQGRSASYNQQLVNRVYAEGHEIACHTWDHPNLNSASVGEIKNQISKSFTSSEPSCRPCPHLGHSKCRVLSRTVSQYS